MVANETKPKKSHRTKFTLRNLLLLVFFVVQVFVQCYFWSDIHHPTSTTATTTTSVKEEYLKDFKKMNSSKSKQIKVLPEEEEKEKEEEATQTPSNNNNTLDHNINCTSWRACFQENHQQCEKFCREDAINYTSSSITTQWVPDVTLVRRMFLQGKDQNGNIWPPPLDDELCEPMGENGNYEDEEMTVYDVIDLQVDPLIQQEEENSNNKLLCLVYTMEHAHATQIRAIRETWGNGCDGFLAFSTINDTSIPAIHVTHQGDEHYDNMWQKVRSIWKYVGEHYQSQFDWFHLGGEDMFLLTQNLKNYLGTFNSSQPYYLGKRFKTYQKEVFNTGGAGYTLSKPTLECLVKHLDDQACFPDRRISKEDVMVSNCLKNRCNITAYDTRDSNQKERYHHFGLSWLYKFKPHMTTHTHPKLKDRYIKRQDWYTRYNEDWGVLLGKECCSPKSVAIHYIRKPAHVRHLFHYLYGGCKRKVTGVDPISSKYNAWQRTYHRLHGNPNKAAPKREATVSKEVYKKLQDRKKALQSEIEASRKRKIADEHHKGHLVHLPNGTEYQIQRNESAIYSNLWYGWQPEENSSMECSWRTCFVENHTCTRCRDQQSDLNTEALIASPVPNGWIPDVTMLRRMYVDGKDSHGNPWPPELDDELCEPMGINGESQDPDMDALNSIGVTTAALSKESTKTSNNKILCLVYTTEESHATNIRAIRETWAPGCDGFLAFSTSDDPRIPAINLFHLGEEAYNNMWQKVRSIWRFVDHNYRSDFDWFYLGGEDMFVLPQNLKNFLSKYNSSEPHYLGRRFKTNWRFRGSEKKHNFESYLVRYNSGGPGYALTASSLKCLAENLDDSLCSPHGHSSFEDVEVSNCLLQLCNVTVEDTRDSEDRERFHHFSPFDQVSYKPMTHTKLLQLTKKKHWLSNKIKIPKLSAQERIKERRGADWFANYNVEWGIRLGKDCCAPDSVAFHYVKKPAQMRHLFHYLHSCKGRNVTTSIANS